MSSSRTSAWKRCLHTGQCVCWNLRIRFRIKLVQCLSLVLAIPEQHGIALIQAAVYRNPFSLLSARVKSLSGSCFCMRTLQIDRLSHGCSFWVIAAWCLSPCVRSFDRGSYYTFFDQLGMDFLFNVYVFWVCVVGVWWYSLKSKKNQNQMSCKVESSLETMKHIGDAMLRML